jgi:hypothetical protein
MVRSTGLPKCRPCPARNFRDGQHKAVRHYHWRMEQKDERREPTEKWRYLPERIDPSQMVEMVDRDPQVEEIQAVSYGQEYIRIEHR